ncbi:hypothetical protein Tco_0603250 [Tanacetum coccineum]
MTDLVTKLCDKIRVLEDDLKKTKQTYSSAFTKLILRVKKLEAQIKIGKARRRAKIVHSDDEDIADDSSKQGRILSDAEVQEKASNETEPVIQDVTPTEVIQDQESSEKGSATIRLEEQMNEEQRAQIARNEEIARLWDEKERQRAMAEAKSTKKIDWNDPSVISIGSEKMTVPEKIEEKVLIHKKNVKEVVKELEEFIYIYNVLLKSSEDDASSKNYKVLSEMLEDFDRQDVEELYKLVKERYNTSRPEGYDLMLWGDLLSLLSLDEKNGIAIHMLTEKKYPLKVEEMFERIISKGRRLEDLIQKKLVDLKDNHKFRGGFEKELILLMVKAADLEISMHGDYYGMLVTDPKR